MDHDSHINFGNSPESAQTPKFVVVSPAVRPHRFYILGLRRCLELGVRRISLISNLDFTAEMKNHSRNEANKQYSLLDIVFNYIFYLGPDC